MRDTLTANGQTVPARQRMLWWQKQGLSFTATGYGRRIPTSHQVQLPGSPRWRRVFCCIFSNSGTCYVEDRSRPKNAAGRWEWIIIDD